MDNKSSLESIEMLLSEFAKSLDDKKFDFPIHIIGNKNDLERSLTN